MGDNINKTLYLGVGVILLVMALTSFYHNNQSFIRYNSLYKNTDKQKGTWIKEVTTERKNPLGISVSGDIDLKSGLVFSGSDGKVQLLALFEHAPMYIIYKEGIEVLDSDYVSLYNSIEESDQLLITYDESLKVVYILTL